MSPTTFLVLLGVVCLGGVRKSVEGSGTQNAMDAKNFELDKELKIPSPYKVGYIEDHPWVIKMPSCNVAAKKYIAFQTDATDIKKGCIVGTLVDFLVTTHLKLNISLTEFASKAELVTSLQSKSIDLGLSPFTSEDGGGKVTLTSPLIDGSDATKQFQTDKTTGIVLSLPLSVSQDSDLTKSYNKIMDKRSRRRWIRDTLENWMNVRKAAGEWETGKQKTVF